jgi:hypothetical protein
MSVALGCSDEEINIKNLFLPQLPISQPFSKLRPLPRVIFRQSAFNPLLILSSLFKSLLILTIIQRW